MGQLYLVRHGKTALNGPSSGGAGDRIRGWENVPLDGEGRAQATRLGRMFETKGVDDIYSSDLSRASDTADAIAATAGVKACPEMVFRPWNLGVFQGQESVDVAPAIRGFVIDSPEEPVPGGESFYDFTARFLPAFEKLLELAHTGKTVVLVTHYRCVKLAEAWLANGQEDQLAIAPDEFLKANLEPSDVLCVSYDAVAGKWVCEPEDDTTAGEETMRDKAILCEVPALPEGETRQRIQVFPAPDDYVHPKTGPFTLTRDHLDEFAADLNARAVPLDRDHAFYKGMSAPAAGWFQPGTAVADDTGVTVEVEYTPKAAQEVRDREYRYVSPEFAFGHSEPDGRKVSEPILHAATLTNRPFFKMMAPIAAEDLAFDDELTVAEAFGDAVADTLTVVSADAAREIIAAAVAKVGAKPGDAASTAGVSFADPGYQKDGRKRYQLDSADNVTAAWRFISRKSYAAKYTAEQISRIKARIRRAAKKFGVTVGADATAGGDMDLTAMAEAAGLAADASEDDVLAAFKKIAAERDELRAKVESLPDMATLIASATAGEKAAKDLAEMKKTQILDDAVKAGKIVPAERSHYDKLYDYDPDGVATLLAEKPVVVALTPVGSGNARVFDAKGQPLGTDGAEITADMTPQSIDGVSMDVDADSAKLHAATEAVLASQGKASGYSEADYVAALAVAASQTGIDPAAFTIPA